MSSGKNVIIDMLINGPSPVDPKDDGIYWGDSFRELIDDLVQSTIAASDMDEESSDTAWEFADWLNDLFYGSWNPWKEDCDDSLVDNSDADGTSCCSSRSESPNALDISSDSAISLSDVLILAKEKYTKKEDTKILKYIIENRKFSKAKGCSLWKEMTEHKVILRKSAHSMKKRYYKTIVPNITVKMLAAIYAELL